MIEIKKWTEQFLAALEETFGGRIWFFGLQGSYGRGEATEDSDIDLVVILDELSPADIQAYSRMLERFAERPFLCGFLAGKEELLSWDAADLFQFYYDTQPIKGSLAQLLCQIGPEAANRAVQTGVCGIYHACVHNMLYEKDEAMLRCLYKSASFVIQAVVYLQTGRYVRKREELMEAAGEEERRILRTFAHLKQGGAIEFGEMSETLFLWTKKWIGKEKLS